MDAGLTPIFLFPTYAHRTAAQKEGIPEAAMPPFSPNAPRKSWYDPKPPEPDSEGNVVYDVVAHTALGTVKLRDGKPYYTKLRLTPEQARTMNLQPQGPPEFPNIGEVPMPCRLLASDEEFVLNGFSGWKVAKKVAAPQPTAGGAVDYSARFDRIEAMLAAITEELTSK